MDANLFILIFVSLLFSAFFSGMEIAFVSSNKVRVGLDVKQSGVIGRVLNVFYRNEEHFISTLLVGNNIALVIYGIGMADLLEPLIARIWDNGVFVVVMQTLLSTLLILFTGEFLPKTVFRINPNSSLHFFALPLYLIYLLLYPLAKFTSLLSEGIMRLVGVKITHRALGTMMSKVELDSFIQESIDSSPAESEVEPEVKMFRNVLDFSNLHLRDCMIPRTEIQAVDEQTTTEELLDAFVSTGLSKVIVYRENIDNVLGYIMASEMFENADRWKERVRPVVFAPETMSANKLMRMLMQQKKSIAIVIDEFGGTAGLVTLEDLVEEIFGEIEDEHDNRNWVARMVEEGVYELSGRMEIEAIHERFEEIDIPESDEYQTLAGYILYHYQTLPRQGETVTIGRYEFTILRRKATKIELVRMKILE